MSAGKVRTVLGDVEPSALGVTMTHEHLLIRFGRWRTEAAAAAPLAAPPGEPRDPRDRTPITLETVGWARRYGGVATGNYVIDEVDVAIDETRRFAEAGGGTIVDATNPDLTRRAEALVSISEATGVHVVMGCGHYVNGAHPPDMDARSEDQLFEEIVGDVTRGCDGTEIRAGIIGEIGCEAPMHANERKVLRAATRASRATGAALLIHPGRATSAPLEAMQVVAGAGGDPERTIVGHIDRTLFEDADIAALARTGCYVEFDLFGQESSYYSQAPIDMPNDATRIDRLRALIAEGFEEKLLIAQDICRKTSLVKYGGEGYAHIIENVVPIMRRKGMTEDQVDSILVRNPARILAMVEPAS